VEEIYRQVVKPAVDAKYEIRDGCGYLVPHQDGMAFNKTEAAAIIEKNRNNDRPYIIPLNVLKPKVYSSNPESQLFKDTLSCAASKMTNHNENRLNNLRLAASKINGVILNPNETFSYNTYIGEVSYENGFREATIYSDGKLGRGIGGGVCQISSVLYSAALQANLKIIKRSNHSFTVDYLPLGHDATFAGSEKDLRFKNSTKNPIKILASVDDNGAYVTILGTNPDKDIGISIENIIRKTIPFKTIQSVDSSLPDNTIMIVQKGKNGYEVDTYRILSKNGNTIKREFIYKSKYASLDQIEKVNCKPRTTNYEP